MKALRASHLRTLSVVLATCAASLVWTSCAPREPISDAGGPTSARGSTTHKVTLTWPEWQQQGQAQLDDTTTVACVTRLEADYRSGRIEVTVRIRSNFRQQLVVPRDQVTLVLGDVEYPVDDARSRRDADLWIQGFAASAPWTLRFQAPSGDLGPAKLRFARLRLVEGDQKVPLEEALEVVVPIPKRPDA